MKYEPRSLVSHAKSSHESNSGHAAFVAHNEECGDYPQPQRETRPVHKSAVCSRNISFAGFAAQQMTSSDPAAFRTSAKRAGKAVFKTDIK
jgi:hypothetical protein